MSAPRRYLFVAAAGSGHGLGHLSRCRRLAERLMEAGPQREPLPRIAFLASHLDEASRRYLLRGKGKPQILSRVDPRTRWDLIVLDKRSTTVEELRSLQACGPVICLDEGGEARQSASFLIDAIPRLPGGDAPNLSSLSFLELPPRSRRKVRWPPKKALVSFGGEDTEDLSGRLIDVLLARRLFSPSQITLVEGPLFRRHDWPDGITVVRSPAHFSRIIGAHDVVFTHFGLTAMEAVASGVPSILLDPGPYHTRLSRTSGFPEIGTRVPDAYALKALLADKPSMQARVESFNARLGPGREWQLPKVISSLHPKGSDRCPVCHRTGNRVVVRFADRTYRACGECGVTYLESFAEGRVEYHRDYFGRAYKAHYGRTYLQDFEAIRAASRERLGIIRSISGKHLDGAIVDVGCAFGPFLAAARDVGFSCFGIEVSEEAALYVRKNLDLPVVCAPFEQVEKKQLPRRISAVTLWYVIEHFPDVGLVLKKISGMLPTGGVLAFSTPNGQGISARKNARQFLADSPPDHFTIFKPAGLDRVLSAHGFELRRIRVTGHHPERFPGCLGKAARGQIRFASRIFGLGDTFEAYAVKVDRE